MPFEDSIQLDDVNDQESLFDGDTSPVGRRKSSMLATEIRSGAKAPEPSSIMSPSKSPKSPKRDAKKSPSDKSLSAITYEDGGDDNNDYDDYGGGGDDDYMNDDGFDNMEHDQEPSDSASKRRVSFGQDTSAESKSGISSSIKRARGRPPKTPESTGSSIRSTPDSGRSVRTEMSTPGSTEFARGRQELDETFEGSDDEPVDRTDVQDTDSDEDRNASGFAEDSFASAVGKRKTYADADDDEEDEDDDFGGSRRSRRVTKGKKLAWWKGERPVYDGGRMIGLLTANPTPKKAKLTKGGRPVGQRSAENGANELSIMNMSTSAEVAIVKAEKPIVLPEDVTFIPRRDGEALLIWDDDANSSKTLKVLCFGETNQNLSALPITADRPEGKDKVGFAAQSFNVDQIGSSMSGWISGFVELPAGAIKDQEGVGECAQVFFVSECQDGALELGIADPAEPEWNDETAQRLLLKKGDTFFVPPGNIYRLENHSADRNCFIFWTIVKPIPTNASNSSVSSADNSNISTA